jgi:DNA-binding MarR family transcriptional regulator
VGLSLAEFMVLRQLELAERGLSMTELGQLGGMSAAGTTKVVARLVEAGYVQLARPTPDRRVQQVGLLPAAHEPLAAAHVTVQTRLADLPAVLRPTLATLRPTRS